MRFVPTRATRTRAALVSAFALLGAGLTVGVSASPAAALAVESATPSPGSASTSAPSEVRLEFDELVFITDFTLTVTGPGGDVRNGIPIVFGRTVTQRLDGDLPDGRYTVSWSVNGGILNEGGSGSFTFRVTPAARPPAASLPAAPPARPTSEASATTTPEAKPTRLSDPVATTGKPAKGVPIAGAKPTVNVPQPDVAGVDTTSAEWLPPPAFWWGLVALAVLVAVLWRRRRNRPAPEGDDVPEPLLRQTELVLGAGAGLTAPDGPPASSLTPTQGVPRLALVPSPATPPRGFQADAVAAEMFTPHTPPASMPRIDFVPEYNKPEYKTDFKPDYAPDFDPTYDALDDPLTDPLPAQELQAAEPPRQRVLRGLP